MKKLNIKSLYILILILCSTAGFGQHTVSIQGYGKKIHDGDTIYLSYRSNGQYILKTAVASNKRFSFTEPTSSYPIKASIYRNENPTVVDFISESVEVYLEPGKIKITSPDTLTGAIIKGTPLNNTLQQLKKQLAELQAQRMKIKDPDMFSEEELKDTALVNYNKKEISRIFYNSADIKLAFAKKHPNSYVSLNVLYDISGVNSYIFKVEEVFDQLADDLKVTPQGKMITERIMKKKQVMPGTKVIDFAMKDKDDNTVSLSSFSGNYILLDFWASWCGPCREEHPSLIAIHDLYATKGLTIISVSIDTNKDKWLQAIDQDRLSWTQLSDLKGNNGEVYLKYGITSIPANFLIAPNGTIIAKDLKTEALKIKLAELL